MVPPSIFCHVDGDSSCRVDSTCEKGSWQDQNLDVGPGEMPAEMPADCSHQPWLVTPCGAFPAQLSRRHCSHHAPSAGLCPPQTHWQRVAADWTHHQASENPFSVSFIGKIHRLMFRLLIFPCGFWWGLGWQRLQGTECCDLRAALLTGWCCFSSCTDQCVRNTETGGKKLKSVALKALKHVFNSYGLQQAVRTCWTGLLTGVNILRWSLDNFE